MIEEQAVFGPPREVVQADAQVLEETLDLAQFAGLAPGDQAPAREVAPVATEAGGARDPSRASAGRAVPPGFPCSWVRARTAFR